MIDHAGAQPNEIAVAPPVAMGDPIVVIVSDLILAQELGDGTFKIDVGSALRHEDGITTDLTRPGRVVW